MLKLHGLFHILANKSQQHERLILPTADHDCTAGAIDPGILCADYEPPRAGHRRGSTGQVEETAGLPIERRLDASRDGGGTESTGDCKNSSHSARTKAVFEAERGGRSALSLDTKVVCNLSDSGSGTAPRSRRAIRRLKQGASRQQRSRTGNDQHLVNITNSRRSRAAGGCAR